MKKVAVDYEKMYYGFPVILISFYDADGKPNVTPISSSYSLKDMMMLGFSSKGYAVKKIKAVRDFVINIPGRSLMDAITYCGAHSGQELSKFDHVDLTHEQAHTVNAPVIRECPVAIECTMIDVIEHDQFKGITNILAKIQGRYVAGNVLNEEGGLQASELDNILYFGDGRQKSFRFMQ
ncbi:flavin reductase family protein [Paenibacillus typhae]|uniref:flavin reductase family protein n=1 Tax=Paenibacillus typhae TaxID=1174501 RepID=UPI001C8EB9E4|nr:flavin reductase family protein [Paenibacillus typhae]MBY0011972.1 flavin reductase family protein [Paenibacillus typhae]